MKFAVHALNFCSDQFILRFVENCGPHVDKIYLAYPKRAWAYNPEAREKAYNSADQSLLRQSKFFPKIVVIEGDWGYEEEARNECLAIARRDGMDFLIVQDLDEFYTHAAYEENCRCLAANRQHHTYRAPWIHFWRDIRHVVQFRRIEVHRGAECVLRELGGTRDYMVAYAVNCITDVRFVRRRLPAPDDTFAIAPGPCCHLGMVLNDEEVERKITTWSHCREIQDAWLRLKWKGWRPETKNLGLLQPASWLRAVPFEGELPDEIKDFEPGPQQVESLSAAERLKELAYDTKHVLRYRAILGRRKLRSMLPAQ